ncbi:Methyltransferase-like protein 22 [Chytriomyces hyalinus]|nr:Methyltransferase-like protein 22 [Chytriomyces hyalinus]KAJ3401462.1 Methyltransferase-like protein 22 [Chytriomyces hyalinus]
MGKEPSQESEKVGVDSDAHPQPKRAKVEENDDEREDEGVLSSVHVHPTNGTSPLGKALRVTHFSTTIHKPCITYRIHHRMATAIEAVGLQVWPGALLLMDYILWKKQEFESRVVVEIGAGTGLASIACASVARKVFATDIAKLASADSTNDSLIHSDGGNESTMESLGILDLLSKNVAENLGSDTSVCVVRELDLVDDACPLFQFRKGPKEIDSPDSGFAFSSSDIHQFDSDCTVLLGADIIYMDFVTFHFVRRLPVLLLKRVSANGSASSEKISRLSEEWESRILYLSLERRIHFSKDECRITAPAWDFFTRTVEAINLDMAGRVADDGGDLDPLFPRVQIKLEQVIVDDMPQYFEYERVKELELWRVYLVQDALQEK